VIERRLHSLDIVVGGFEAGAAAAESASAELMVAFCTATAAAGWTSSSLASNWPLRTRSPSLTRISVISPMALAPMLM